MLENRLYTIVLAAGAATRFGSTKQLAAFRGQTLVARAVRAAERISGQQSLLVVGNDWQAVAEACAPICGFMVHNPQFPAGMATSIVAGIRAVCNVADGVLLLLADQPLIEVEQLRDLSSAWQSAPERIFASQYADTMGPPVIFPAECFQQLLELKGDCGARAVLDNNRERLTVMRLDEAALDIDLPEDLPDD